MLSKMFKEADITTNKEEHIVSDKNDSSGGET